MVTLADGVDPNLLWNEIASVAQGTIAILTAAAVAYSFITFKRSLKALHYAELDKMYFEILRTAIDKPYLRAPGGKHTTEQAAEYDIYAYVVWNFIETVYDYCMKDEELRKTWYPAMEAENRLHRAWFNDTANHHKFKAEFHKFVKADGFLRR
jgi:hypothetical protein